MNDKVFVKESYKILKGTAVFKDGSIDEIKNVQVYSKINVDPWVEELQAENEKLKKEVADYHQLQWQHDALIDENERLKKNGNTVVFGIDTDKKTLVDLMTENERLKPIIGDEEYMQGLKGLAENNLKLRDENERLKGEVRKWKRDSAITSAMFRLVVQGKECTSTKVLEEAERVENLENENAKLKCLALHLFERVAKIEANEWASMNEWLALAKNSRIYKGHEYRWLRIAKRCGEAYRKAKAKLRSSNG